MEEPAKKENAAPVNATVKFDSKTEALKQTVRKIVRANNEFLQRHSGHSGLASGAALQRAPIEVSPKEVVFEAVSAGLDYFTTLTVTNLTAKQRKVKIKLPKSPLFTFDNSETVLVAPGLRFQCKVFYRARSAEELHDQFAVISDDHSVVVPLSVFPPRGVLVFEPAVSLGFVQPETPVPFQVRFSNAGQEPLTIEFASSDEFSLSSPSFPLTVLPGAAETGSFEAIFSRTGLFKSLVTFSVQGQAQRHHLDLSATVVSFSSFLVDEKGNEVSVLNFEEILLGDERLKRLTLVNNSPRPSQFKVQILKGVNNEPFRDQAKPQTPYDLGVELSEQVIFAEPSTGLIEPYGYQVLTFKLRTAPTLEERYLVSKFAISDDSFDAEQLDSKSKRSFNYTAFVAFDESGGQKVLQIFATAFAPLVNFSLQNLQFGKLSVGEQRKLELSLTNFSPSLPVQVTPPHESFLHFEPRQLTLGPKETKVLLAEFCPKNLGVFDGKCAFKVNKSFDVHLDFVGSAVSGDRRHSVAVVHQGDSQSHQPTASGGHFGRSGSVQAVQPEKGPKASLPRLADRKLSLAKRTRHVGGLELPEPIPGVGRENPALFVLKPVKNNEPNSLRTVGGRFTPDPRLAIREFPSSPKDYEEARQLSEKLSGEKLMRLQVGPTELNFGKVFVNSSVALSFQIKNDLWSSIVCGLNTDRVPELRETPQRQQVIPSGKVAGFKVVVNSPVPKVIRERVGYTINGAHNFHFFVHAEVVPVDLEVARPVVNFKFREESLELTTVETVTLKNNGNSPAHFRIRSDNAHSPFRVLTLEGTVKENSSKDIEILYCPMSPRDEDVVYLEIEKGAAAKPIRCVGTVNETSCELMGGPVNFGSLAVGQRKSASFTVRNTHTKYNAVFKLDETTLPEGVEVRPKSGKVCPEDIVRLELDFSLRKKAEFKNHEIQFQVRGSAPLKLLFTAATVVPTVEVEQAEFDFDKVTFGNKSSLPLTISNKSAIPAELFLGLTAANPAAQEKLDCISIEYPGRAPSDSLVLERTEADAPPASQEEKAASAAKNLRTALSLHRLSVPGGKSGSLSQLGEKKEAVAPATRQRKGDSDKPGKNVFFYLKPSRTYNFELVFSPAKPSVYDFDLVFSVPGQETGASMVRRVRCVGTNPRFLMEPLSGLIEFPRKIIISPESVVADQRTLTISNPSFDEPLTWSLNTASIDQQSTFTVTPSSGVIDPQCTVTLKVSFRPLKPQVYEASIPLFIDGKSAPHTEIKLRGEGSFPKVLYSAEELILPPTPLNVAAFGYVSLANDGYQNSSFTLSVPSEYVKLGLSVEFLNGNQLGINNQKIILKVSFVSPTPVGFTARVNVEDDLKRSFSFSVSGATDNSVLTHASFLALGFTVNSMFRAHLDSLEAVQCFDSEFRACQSIAVDQVTKSPKFALRSEKKQSTAATASQEQKSEAPRTADLNASEESDLVAIEYYSQVGQTIRSWLAGYGIATVNSFPEDVCQSNGSQFYELLEFLLKSPPSKPAIDPTLKSADRVAALVQGYYNLLNFLKENNAMVNTVRPHFLLSHKDLLCHFKSNAVPHLVQDYYKVSEVQFRLLSLQSWTTLFLQAIKVFFVSRITAKEFKSALLLLTDKRRREGVSEEHVQGDPVAKPDGRRRGTRDGVAPFREQPRESIAEADQADRDSGLLASRLMPEYPYDKNGVYSSSEALLLRWLEVTYEMKMRDSVRIAGFGKELSNFFIFSCAVDVYLGGESGLVGKVKQNAILNDEIAANYDLFKVALYDFGVKEEFNDRDFSPSNPIGLLLLAAHLFKTLPPYVPRATIEFNCALHERVVKEISLTNPSAKPISYTVKLFGPKNFAVDTDLVKLEGKQTVLVPVAFSANTSFPVEGKVFFQNRRNGKSVAGAVVFALKAAVVSRFSMRTFTVSNVGLYEIGNSEITVANPFDKDVDFKIRIENVPCPEAPVFKPAKQKKGAREQPKEEPPTSERPDDFLPSFFIKQDRLWIRRGSVSKLYVQYLPITFETHRCLLVFLDPKVGEMQYEILGTPRPPAPLDTFRVTIPIESLTTVELAVPLKNALFNAALTRLSDKIKESKEFTYLPIVDRMTAALESAFDIELSPPEFLACTSPVQFAARRDQPPSKQGAKETPSSVAVASKPAAGLPTAASTGKIMLIPTKKVPFKDLHVKVCLKGRRRFDHRFYDLFLTVLPKTIKATIEIRTTARIPVTQNIPITNNNDLECTIRPSFSPVLNGHLFDVPINQFQVKKRSLINFPLKFYSAWVEKAEGRLTLFNATTNDCFEYLLKVDCEEPLSENHEEVFTKAKKPTEVTLRVKNPMPEVRAFKVDCDIPDAEFPRRVTFEDSKTIDLKVAFVPIIGGSFMYSVTFTDDAGRYFWHLLTVHVDSPEPLRTLLVTTEVRRPVACRVELDNPTARAVVYKVVLVGDFLSGDQSFELGPGSRDAFTLYYFPLRVENVRKKVGFLSDSEGEVWFDVDCRCEESKPVKLPTFKAELGKSVAQQLVFKNPLKRRAVFVNAEFKENTCFSVAPRKFEMGPAESVTVDVTFVPRELNKSESELITFVSSEIGDWKYQVFGLGIPPTEFETTTLATVLGKSVTRTFAFKNPFVAETAFSLAVETVDSPKELFEMLVPKAKNVTLGPLATLQVIVKFSPSEICTYRGKLTVRAGESLQWVFPIVGIAEAVQSSAEFVLKTKCGVEVEETSSYRLAGLAAVDPEEAFDYTLKVNHKDAESIEKWLRVKQLKSRLSGPDDELSFAFSFLPHKPLKAGAELIVSRPSGGRWKFRLMLVATDPDFFDTLNIVSQLNVRKTIQFRLFNSDKKTSSPFAAYFTQDSDSEFMVSPAKGTLEPFMNNGTLIEVSYLPTQYGKTKTAVLVVETETSLWRFAVKGLFEKYVPPRPNKHLN